MQLKCVTVEEEKADVETENTVKVVRGIKSIKRSTNDFRRNV